MTKPEHTAHAPPLHSILQPPLPPTPGAVWGQLYGSAYGLLIASAARRHHAPVVVVTPDMRSAWAVENELRCYAEGSDLDILNFPDWETLPYDVFSPHQDIISQRIEALYRLPALQRGVLVVPAATLMQRLAPRSYLTAHSLIMKVGDKLDIEALRMRLEQAGYRCVPEVMEHGEYAVRGALLDLYPMGSDMPYRIDLLDDEIDSLRCFDPETQRSQGVIDAIRLLPGREYPFSEDAVTRFRKAFRARFEGDPQRCQVYRDVSRGSTPPGIEYYLPLFFETTETLFDYLPADCLMLRLDGAAPAYEQVWSQLNERHEQYRHDAERPILPPGELFLDPRQTAECCRRFAQVDIQRFELTGSTDADINFTTTAPPPLTIDARSQHPYRSLTGFIDGFNGRILFAAESAGRREVMLELLAAAGVRPAGVDNWQAFLAGDMRIAITIAPIDQGLLLTDPPLAVIAEPQLFGERVLQKRRRARAARDADAIIRNLTELAIGAPVVHEDHGVGRYLGLQHLTVGDMDNEFLALEYADGDKLYVPVSSLHLISRYTGAAPEGAPLHKLGSDQWTRARRRAAERVRDVAAELLELYARRAARKGHAFHVTNDEYAGFAAAFPFEETPDQQSAIDDALGDLASDQPMDRVVCGDVGFGKTEVALRAAFIAAQDNRQVAVLVPTTLLAQQHYVNFRDRFADWPMRIEVLSRFGGQGKHNRILEELADGKVDIVIGTHKLLQSDVKFKNLGLVILDEEHRFGVRQKERLKALRAEVDVLTLTATPIPRTLNMSLAGLRDLSIIATPPAHRHAIKTFVTEWNGVQIREACLREIQRGGQIYFLHNDVKSIERMARDLHELVPEADVRIAHGQMRERDLEQVMLDFYHRRFNLLVCSTIIESGIDVPNANTILINRADKLGLAQLHQLRGRVGRSHHRAYAYLIVPPRNAITADAVKRLEAIESLEALGAGFTLATHDLEIRGAGELLGEDQSGQIHEVGFTLYNELLQRTIAAMRAGKTLNLDAPPAHAPEIDLGLPALIPDDYLPDVHARLIIYKRIANAANSDELRELQVEMIDRFGLLPDPVNTLFAVTALKLKAAPLGIRRIEAGPNGGRMLFDEKPAVDPAKIIKLIQEQSRIYKLDGKDRLRFTMDLTDAAARLDNIDRILDTLSD